MKQSFFCSGLVLVVVCLIGWAAMAAPSRGIVERDKQTVQYEDVMWAVESVVVLTDASDVFAVASPERLDLAGGILANLLSDPSFRYQVQVWFEHYVSINHPPDEAAAMAKGHAADIALAFTDALIEAAGG